MQTYPIYLHSTPSFLYKLYICAPQLPNPSQPVYLHSFTPFTARQTQDSGQKLFPHIYDFSVGKFEDTSGNWMWKSSLAPFQNLGVWKQGIADVSIFPFLTQSIIKS